MFFHPEHQTLGDYESFPKRTPSCFSCQAIEDSEVLIFNHAIMQFLEAAPNGQKMLRLVAEDLAFMLRDQLDQIDGNIAVGKPVTKGQLVGKTGARGSTRNEFPAHLHYEVLAPEFSKPEYKNYGAYSVDQIGSKEPLIKREDKVLGSKDNVKLQSAIAL
ncbi:MAG: hypothetical protein U7127_00915 [Phormidium sp.]